MLVAVSEMGVVLRRAGSESQRVVILGYLTVSTNVRCFQFCLSTSEHTDAVYRQRSQTAAVWNLSQTTVQSWTTESYSSATNKTDEIKQRLVEVWQSSITAFEWKDAIYVFCQGNAEAQVRWQNKACFDCLLYFYQQSPNLVLVCQSYSKPKVWTFWEFNNDSHYRDILKV